MKRTQLHVRTLTALILAALALTVTNSATAQQNASLTSVAAGPADAALHNAARDGKYLFVYFYKQDDQQTQSMQGVFDQATGQMADVANAIRVNITDPSNASIVQKFGVSRAPMPLSLAIAPNGAVTQGLPVSFNEKQLQEAVVSPGTADCMKAMQDRKLVLVCVKEKIDAAAFQGARELTQDERFAGSTQIVNIDPADASEHSFLQSLKVDTSAGNGVLVVLTPAGQPVATIAETATKDQIIQRLTAASSSCCPDGKCAPGQQCCPGGNCAPAKK
ncbi:hypothetical protein Poly24_17020 [Rosistilla carotiformis]|uniref:Thioredoxin domain-containing protein n=1 Tax=Rosistilla carotiformis TaxID=2528017 RepID=A0A518JR48_9BACT|nr:hypothetical protein [Rosistilla carotiformis]QDV67996.1 hypothetical protein Poly24_17020 [Rosistilla carotiformis]